jgi:hypothetical protein
VCQKIEVQTFITIGESELQRGGSIERERAQTEATFSGFPQQELVKKKSSNSCTAQLSVTAIVPYNLTIVNKLHIIQY